MREKRKKETCVGYLRVVRKVSGKVSKPKTREFFGEMNIWRDGYFTFWGGQVMTGISFYCCGPRNKQILCVYLPGGKRKRVFELKEKKG